MRVAKLRAQEIAWRRHVLGSYNTVAYRRPLWSSYTVRQAARMLVLILLLTVADLLRAFL